MKIELDATKEHLMMGLLLINLLCTAVLAVVSYENRAHSQSVIHHISLATEYTCNTTQALDTIINQGIQQLQQNFKLHEYSKLLKAGILTKHDVAVAHHDFKLYQKYDKQLKKNIACNFTVKSA